MGDMLKKAYDDSMLDCPEKPTTSKLKCPVCDVPLTACGDLLFCPNDHCAWAGNAELWQALIQAKQDLEIARKAMNQVMSMGAKNNICYHLKAKTVKSILGNALEQITHDNSEKANSQEHKEEK